MSSQEVRHDWANNTIDHYKEKFLIQYLCFLKNNILEAFLFCTAQLGNQGNLKILYKLRLLKGFSLDISGCRWAFHKRMTSEMIQFSSVQFNSLLSCVQLFVTPWTEVGQASLSISKSRTLPKLMSVELVMPSNHLILCRPLLSPSIFPSNRVFSNESALYIR